VPFLAELLALLAPPACAACRAPVGRADALVCAACLRALPWLGRGSCPRCALPAHRRGGCPAGAASFERAWAPLAYDGPARALVAALKFRGALPLAGLMAAQVAANLPEALRAADAVVPVPPQPARGRRRGYDPAALLAAGVAERLALPLVAALRRRDRAARQVGTARARRREPGRLHVEAIQRAPSAVLLVDDVHTTGATLEAAAAALRGAGVQRVAAVTYARTL